MITECELKKLCSLRAWLGVVMLRSFLGVAGLGCDGGGMDAAWRLDTFIRLTSVTR